MNAINCWFRQFHKISLAWAGLSLVTVSTILTTVVPSARADQIRTCERYGVVRDLSDHEVPLLPRRSIASCARSYQTLYQTYRVLTASPDSQTSDSDIDAHTTPLQAESPTSTSPVRHESGVDESNSSNHRPAQ
ncbi:hypothetical protein [Leptolyngbya ohadii]|uniref:hypothetical protein n=1 Tax=Leptolyngbya ohadii TaxID=1962290 RepID=UPI00117A4908|nr:hypothetical protein [Leptolyngbya ohadii]